MAEQVPRRTVLAVGLASVASTAGCLGSFSPGGGPEQRSLELAVTGSMEAPGVSISPAPAVEGVVTVGVGDDVTFEYVNELGSDYGVHNHVTDVETVVEAGGTAAESFDVTEAMVGRHELEGFVPGDHAGGEHSEEEGEHSGGTKTATHEEDDHGGTETATHEGGHSEETATATDDHGGETATATHEEEDGHSEEGDHAEEATLAVVEVRPG